MYLLPKPQKMNIMDGFLKNKTVQVKNYCDDKRIEKALEKLPCAEQGTELELRDNHEKTEGYTLKIEENKITILGDSAAGVFYGIQTLRQIFDNGEVPCLMIEDNPGFEHRGFYHDVTRGKIPTVETTKALIDEMAYYKMNSLQFYIEHTFAFKEFGCSVLEKNGYITADEIRELDDYCYENFIEFIPSLSTFGHLYELLEQDEYKNLRELPDYVEDQLYWRQRMLHHTINPTEERSIEVIKSMIDQYVPLFRSNYFNICCDETFDLKIGVHKDMDTGKIYIDFVKKIIAHLQAKNKTVMMWGDILLQHPETITELPEDVEFLNWNYSGNAKEDQFETFGKLERIQIVCPGTSTWSRFVEGMDEGSRNILRLGDYGYKYNAKGMLNTNWGDYGNPCSLELSMHGLVLGACKSWNKETDKDEYFTDSINYLLYKNDNAVKYLTELDEINKKVSWNRLSMCYSNFIYEKQYEITAPEKEDLVCAQKGCVKIINDLKDVTWELDEYRQEILLAAEGLLVMAEQFGMIYQYEMERVSDTEQWLQKYRVKWLEKNKESELFRIEDMFRGIEKALDK